MAFLLLGSFQVSGQVIANLTIEPADNPNLGGTSVWPFICAGANNNFNEYYAIASFDGGSNSGNEWILELSDASGNFASPVELARETSDATVQNPGFQFAIPTDTRGAGYKLRVRSTNPVATAETAVGYEMYYMDFTSSLLINEDGGVNPPTDGSICSSNPVTLQVANVTNPGTYQYVWYRNGTALPDDTPSITVSTSGMYQAFVQYGVNCTERSQTDSNVVDVTIGSSGGGSTINPPSKTALCPADTELLTINTTVTSPTYEWFKDGVSTGVTSATYTVDGSAVGFEGDYQVEISSTGNCPEITPAITFTNAGNFTVTRVNAPNIVLLPSDTERLSVTTTATSPSYLWFRNGVSTGVTTDFFDATQEGTYYCEVTQPAGICPSETKINSETTEVVTPQSFEIVIDFVTPHLICEDTSTALEVDRIDAVLADNSRIDVTSDVQSSFTYQWNLNGTPVGGATSSSISLTDTAENGDYTLEGTLNPFNPTSNPLTVQLLTNETVSITSTSTVYCNATDTITLSTTTDLTGESFQWQRDGTSINTTDASLDVNQPGTYRLVIDKNGCPLNSNEIAITPLDPDLITIDPDGTIVFPEGTTRTVTASGGTGYRWYDINNVEISNTASVTLDTEGSYVLIANVDNCEITKQFTAEYLDTFKIPNVITPNGDGFNDQWVLPNSYSNKSDVTVIVYHQNGEELMNVQDYKNDWPDASLAFPQQNMVFYYTIKNANEILKQGTITVIR